MNHVEMILLIRKVTVNIHSTKNTKSNKFSTRYRKKVRKSDDQSSNEIGCTSVEQNVPLEDTVHLLGRQGSTQDKTEASPPASRKKSKLVTQDKREQKIKRFKGEEYLTNKGKVKSKGARGALKKINSSGILHPDMRGKKHHQIKLKEKMILSLGITYIAFQVSSPIIVVKKKKTDLNAVFVKTNHEETTPFVKYVLKLQQGRPSNFEPATPYTNPLPISIAKYRDLKKLCEDLQIPHAYHGFYESLPTQTLIRDTLPELDSSEESEYDETI
ncbi:unnamed protein product [Diabrotica balteata]|uniref:Uncharacterized protein n=1 Tax=Diabrotica balteata TaxID=107213 RepID=A0A9N9T1C0_DIABA|nr:unnamed protein product [Diabrotica balteata]